MRFMQLLIIISDVHRYGLFGLLTTKNSGQYRMFVRDLVLGIVDEIIKL